MECPELIFVIVNIDFHIFQLLNTSTSVLNISPEYESWTTEITYIISLEFQS